MSEWLDISTAPTDGTEILAATACGYVGIWRFDDQKFNKTPRPYWKSQKEFLGVLWHRERQPIHGSRYR